MAHASCIEFAFAERSELGLLPERPVKCFPYFFELFTGQTLQSPGIFDGALPFVGQSVPS